MTDELTKLAERVEAATGADRELNADILEALADERWRQLEHEASLPCGAPPDMIRTEARYKAGIRFDFTGSLDAAMTLVSEGCEWRVEKRCGKAMSPAYASLWSPGARDIDLHANGIGATPALALCAAALKSRASQ